jgi:hypothetical protein
MPCRSRPQAPSTVDAVCVGNGVPHPATPSFAYNPRVFIGLWHTDLVLRSDFKITLDFCPRV